MIPLKDNIPTNHFPVVTVVLIVLNVIVFGWQLSFSGEESSSPELATLGITERDQNSVEYGAIPYRVTHPGKDCSIGVLSEQQGLEAAVVCQGTPEFKQAEERAESDPQAPLAPVDEAVWWVTLFTSMFMHGGFLHIAFNMLFLWVFGNNVEDSMGPVKFVLFYLLAGIAAVYAQSAIDTSSAIPTIGASGAVAGVLGAYALLHPRARVLTLVIIIFFFTLVEIPAMIMLGLWFVLQFLPALGQVAAPEVGGGEGIAYFAHVGGFIFGLAAIRLFATRTKWKGLRAA